MRTCVDANVLIAAFQGKAEIHERAMAILGDPDREFVVNSYLELEVLPKPTYHKQEHERAFMKEFLNGATVVVPSSEELSSIALRFAQKYGLSAMDALHAATAELVAADEFVTAELITKPFFRIREFRISSIAPPPKQPTWWATRKTRARKAIRRALARIKSLT